MVHHQSVPYLVLMHIPQAVSSIVQLPLLPELDQKSQAHEELPVVDFALLSEVVEIVGQLPQNLCHLD